MIKAYLPLTLSLSIIHVHIFMIHNLNYRRWFQTKMYLFLCPFSHPLWLLPSLHISCSPNILITNHPNLCDCHSTRLLSPSCLHARTHKHSLPPPSPVPTHLLTLSAPPLLSPLVINTTPPLLMHSPLFV